MFFLKIELPITPPLRLNNWVLPSDNIHLWCFTLDQLSPHQLQLQSFLAADEQEKSKKYIFEKDRQRYILARGALRYLLGQYLALPPTDIHIVYSSFGKPRIKHHQNIRDIQFNLSHAGNYILISISQYQNIGVDIEFMISNFDFMSIAQHFFSAEEYKTLSIVPHKDQNKLFFEIWTQKEALLKCLGCGLSYPLDKINILSAEPFIIENDSYQVTLISLDPSYQAALAYQGHFSPHQVHCYRQWPERTKGEYA